MMKTVAVDVVEAGLQNEGLALAKRFNIPFRSDASEPYDFLLILSADGLALKNLHEAKATPLLIDFLQGDVAYRGGQASIKKEAIAEAVGLKRMKHPTVLDGTAGLGRDGYILAKLGCSVMLLEKSGVMAALLEDAVKRLLTVENLSMEVKWVDCVEYICHCDNKYQPDIIYLDPMFPPRKKSAKVKKEMQWLSQLVGFTTVEDEAVLLSAAQSFACHRVVVKRPKWAEPLARKKPSWVVTAGDYRFDIYVEIRT